MLPPRLPRMIGACRYDRSRGRLATARFVRGDRRPVDARSARLYSRRVPRSARPGMSVESPLPAPPLIALDVARDRTPESRASGGFVNLRRVDLVARFPDGSVSETFAYDVVERAGIDAVILVVFERVAGQREIYVRSAVRAPLALRAGCDAVNASIWELPAGIVDPGESPRAAAAREIEEELGFNVSAESLLEFAPWTWPAPSFIAERQQFFCVERHGGHPRHAERGRLGPGARGRRAEAHARESPRAMPRWGSA